MPAVLRKAARRWQSQAGMTLAEMVIAVGLITMSVALVGAPMFSVIRADQGWRNTLSATANWRQAAGYLSRDAGKAETISLPHASSTEDSITLVWLVDASTQTVDYTLIGDMLLRTHNGNSLAIARRVTGVEFERDGNLLTMTLTMEDAPAPIQALAALRSLIEE